MTTPRARANGESSASYSGARGWCASITDQDGRRITRKAQTQSEAGAEKLLRQLLRKRDEGAIEHHSRSERWPRAGSTETTGGALRRATRCGD